MLLAPVEEYRDRLANVYLLNNPPLEFPEVKHRLNICYTQVSYRGGAATMLECLVPSVSCPHCAIFLFLDLFSCSGDFRAAATSEYVFVFV